MVETVEDNRFIQSSDPFQIPLNQECLSPRPFFNSGNQMVFTLKILFKQGLCKVKGNTYEKTECPIKFQIMNQKSVNSEKTYS